MTALETDNTLQLLTNTCAQGRDSWLNINRTASSDMVT
jgi:hypothetical protein